MASLVVDIVEATWRTSEGVSNKFDTSGGVCDKNQVKFRRVGVKELQYAEPNVVDAGCGGL